MINSKNEFKLKPEDKLILSCGHSQVNDELEKKIIKLVNLDLDWEYILDMVTRHRLRPLLYYNLNKICPDKVPDDVLVSLREFYHGNVRKNLMMTGELVKVMKLLEENGVNAVTYKGPVLAQMAYGNVGLREFRDIDIFIAKSDVAKAKNIMNSNGYYLDPPIEVDNSTYMKLDCEYRFKNKSGVLIELNWNFEGPFFSFKSDSNRLFSDLIFTKINNFEIITPSAENEFLMMCIHCAKHNWNRLLWIMDLVEVVKNKDINWQAVWKISKELGVNRILIINLILIRDLKGGRIPDEIQLNPDKEAINIVMQIKKRIFENDKSSWNLIEKFFLDLKKRDNIQIGIKDCIYGFSKPSYDDYQDFKISPYFFKFYPFIRPFLLLKRYGKNPI
ncbi:MAG: nucleotidyltransferase family protein [Methanobacteriaceae archaeon]|nr:nucleotidyltransferase family protein [Methanobacteriaceae archaeon]MDO9626623.1 nucleotidyltransferase family protein [Methanobacteriaceae archaeon]